MFEWGGGGGGGKEKEPDIVPEWLSWCEYLKLIARMHFLQLCCNEESYRLIRLKWIKCLLYNKNY